MATSAAEGGGQDWEAEFALDSGSESGVVEAEGFGSSGEVQRQARERGQGRRKRRAHVSWCGLDQGRDGVLHEGVVEEVSMGGVVKSCWIADGVGGEFIGEQGQGTAVCDNPGEFAVFPVGPEQFVGGRDWCFRGGSDFDGSGCLGDERRSRGGRGTVIAQPAQSVWQCGD